MLRYNTSNNDKIEEGDTVMVVFSPSYRILEAEVLYLPVATGDCWHIRDLSSGRLVYVQQFERMILIKKGEQNG